jgi:(E)-4-hydroxy-3-methylbut-2-enyl-diphosphate synthase
VNFSDQEFFPARRKTRGVKVGRLTIGGDAAIVVQSMTKTDTRDVAKTVEQIQQMEAAGCEIVRLAVPDIQAARALAEIRKRCPDSILVSDIHFQHKFALMALDAGIDKLRINPGNIGDAEKVRIVVRRAQEQKVPIRIGVNAGSLERRLLEKYGFPTPEAMVESALYHIRILEELGFGDTIVSLKSSNVKLTVAAYRLLAKQSEYPFHLGITEAGTQFSGTVKSCVDSRLARHRSGGRSTCGLRAAEVAGAAQPRPRGHRLPDVWPAGSGPLQDCGRNRKSHRAHQNAHQPGGHGLRGERARRSPRSGPGCCRRSR